ncbi:unnamed protein product [Hermetia illucens]|uniref:Kazal-like domain-containing protein n=1 Tax=Hermetia illucens TaxID=343691 RepID=A0A7R8UPF5_HERIL|nr:extracellular protease inhibitor 10-like [Hermetia illucens]CAD7084591.1 unnamed protein product [Hermetia illucens]
MICRALILVVLVAAVTADTEPLLCMRYCIQVISDPVCGYNGKVWKTFNSLCDLKNAECSERATYEVKDSAECAAHEITVRIDDPVGPILIDKCNFMCLDVYSPVCGYDGTSYVTFSNSCDMSRGSCLRGTKFEKVADELCGISNVAERISSCGKFCPDYYKPVCGFNGKRYRTFSNTCFMQLANCNDAENYEEASGEKCNLLQLY